MERTLITIIVIASCQKVIRGQQLPNAEVLEIPDIAVPAGRQEQQAFKEEQLQRMLKFGITLRESGTIQLAEQIWFFQLSLPVKKWLEKYETLEKLVKETKKDYEKFARILEFVQQRRTEHYLFYVMTSPCWMNWDEKLEEE